MRQAVRSMDGAINSHTDFLHALKYINKNIDQLIDHSEHGDETAQVLVSIAADANDPATRRMIIHGVKKYRQGRAVYEQGCFQGKTRCAKKRCETQAQNTRC